VRVIYVGRLIYAKGVHDLLAVSHQLWDAGWKFDLEIVGDGNYRRTLEGMANGFTRFTGKLAPEEVITELKASDIFVNPSYSEGLPTSVMEAASVGLGIIATDVGGTREIIEPDYSGLLYQPGNLLALRVSLESFLNHPAQVKLFGQRAKEGIGKFNWDNITRQYIEVLKEVVKK